LKGLVFSDITSLVGNRTFLFRFIYSNVGLSVVLVSINNCFSNLFYDLDVVLLLVGKKSGMLSISPFYTIYLLHSNDSIYRLFWSLSSTGMFYSIFYIHTIDTELSSFFNFVRFYPFFTPSSLSNEKVY
jgi:uncharacterized membrane protein YuzA (DUF378 family)